MLTPKNFLRSREAWGSTQPERRREAAGSPQESWAPASEITAGQDRTALPYPPARPWSRGRGNGEEEAGTVAAPLSSRRSLRRGRDSALGASGMRAYGARGGPNRTWHRGPPATAPPSRRPAPGPLPRPLARALRRPSRPLV